MKLMRDEINLVGDVDSVEREHLRVESIRLEPESLLKLKLV